jgi:hypothetical protein
MRAAENLKPGATDQRGLTTEVSTWSLDRAIVGAGAVVTKNVAPGTTVVGNPVRAIGQVPVQGPHRPIA